MMLGKDSGGDWHVNKNSACRFEKMTGIDPMSKGFRRRNRGEAAGEAIPDVDVVEVERNLVEAAAIKLRHWAGKNQALFRVIVWGTISVIFLSITLWVVISFRAENQAAEIADLLTRQETVIKLFPTEDGRKNQMLEIAKEADSVCNVFLPGKPAASGCLLAASIYSQYEMPQEAAKSLAEFARQTGTEKAGILGHFLAGYAAENTASFDQALEFYNTISVDMKKINREDFTLFHTSRVLYLQNKFEKAEEGFARILKDFPQSVFLDEARTYLRLIASQNAAQ